MAWTRVAVVPLTLQQRLQAAHSFPQPSNSVIHSYVSQKSLLHAAFAVGHVRHQLHHYMNLLAQISSCHGEPSF